MAAQQKEFRLRMRKVREEGFYLLISSAELASLRFSALASSSSCSIIVLALEKLKRDSRYCHAETNENH